VSRCNALARRLAALVDEADDLELLAPVELSIVCFRYLPAALRDDPAGPRASHLDTLNINDLNKAIMEEVQASGEAFLTQTTLHGQFSLRACVVHYATAEADLRALVDIVRRAGARLA
jgi:glutamate/tyrosine decarboxylase-like PLP-dependent enzyme